MIQIRPWITYIGACRIPKGRGSASIESRVKWYQAYGSTLFANIRFGQPLQLSREHLKLWGQPSNPTHINERLVREPSTHGMEPRSWLNWRSLRVRKVLSSLVKKPGQISEQQCERMDSPFLMHEGPYDSTSTVSRCAKWNVQNEQYGKT